MERKYKIALVLFSLVVVLTFGTRNSYTYTLDLLGTVWNT